MPTPAQKSTDPQVEAYRKRLEQRAAGVTTPHPAPRTRKKAKPRSAGSTNP